MAGFPYKKILIIGGTSGIGEALADKFVREGARVIIVGRRQEKLDDIAARLGGADKVEGVQFDITKLDDAAGFADR